jgi:hypothetical protein
MAMTIKIRFEEEKDAEAFLELCKTIAKVLDESEKMKAIKCHQ